MVTNNAWMLVYVCNFIDRPHICRILGHHVSLDYHKAATTLGHMWRPQLESALPGMSAHVGPHLVILYQMREIDMPLVLSGSIEVARDQINAASVANLDKRSLGML
ncbi:hypothetical protein PIIN_10891 [Serendipita indica DSM 11827]|uniref:Uncharacterized protein n=1 Tax=Serendipita indica (strain DSM 11827) TaxID=1109443 RepID=G4U013_SERID|nr:hypothetical protein PIIN_10891 [Serendipita indica DSM 11827]